MTQLNTQCPNLVDSNTTLESPSLVSAPMAAHIDWISLSFRVHGRTKLDKLIEVIQDLLNINIYFDAYRIVHDYTGRYQAYSCSLGCTFSYASFNSDDICNARLTLPGELLASRKPWHIKRVMRRLTHDWGALCTRIDLAVDDYAKQLDFDTIIDATKHHQGVGFRSGKSIESYCTEKAGRTVYCGVRTSAKYARFYEKGEFNRYELECKQGYAKAIFTDYLACSTPDSVDLLSSILRSAISFAIRKDKNLTRAKECDWWVAFRDRIIGVKYKVNVPKPLPSLHRTLKWIHKSVSKSILMASEAVGIDNLKKLLELWLAEAKNRCTQREADLIAQFSAQKYTLEQMMDML